MARKILRYSLVLLALVALVGGIWVYRLVWGKPFDVDHYYERVFLEWFLGEPEYLTFFGFLDNTILDFHSGKLNDVSPTRAREVTERYRRQLARLRSYDRASMNTSQQVSYDVLEWYLDDRLRQADFLFHDYGLNHLQGAHLQTQTVLTELHKIVDLKSARRYIERVGAVKRQFQGLIEGLELREENGVLLPAFALGHIVEQLRSVADANPEENVYYKAFVDRAAEANQDGVDLPIAELEADLRQQLEENLVPAYRGLIEFLEGQQARADDRAGIWKIPNGDAYYAQRLRTLTTTEWTPQEVHDVGLAEMTKITDQMSDVLAEIGVSGDGTKESVLNQLRVLSDDPRYRYPETAEGRAAILADFTEIVEELKTGSAEIFEKLPAVGLRVEAMDASVEATNPLALYSPGAMDGSRDGAFQVNVGAWMSAPSFTMRATASHEAFPGHHVQKEIAAAVQGIPMFRRALPYFDAYIEGWGLYAEQLAAEHGMVEDPLDELGRLLMELRRAARMVVDTGIHHRRWTRQQAIDFLYEQAGLTREEATNEAERYIVEPGQACAYKIGMLKILELRQRMHDALGEEFDLKKFHTLVLESGHMPLSILEETVDNHIAVNSSIAANSSITVNPSS